MAENKKFQTRVQLKYDTFNNWTSNNPTPLSGELCVVVVPAEQGAVAQEPAILFKVGDGKTAFNSLGFASGIAADVYDWAKEENKPTYNASEINGLSEYISGEIEDTDTQYQLVQDGQDGHKIKLQSKAKGTEVWVDVVEITTVDTVYDDAAVKSDISSLKTLVGNTAVATQIATAIKAIQDGTSIDSFKDVETTLEDYATKTEAQGYADAKDASIAAAKQAGDNAKSAVDELSEKIGEVESEKTVVQMIEEAKTAATYNDTDIKSRMTQAETKLDTLNGEGAGSVKKAAEDAATAAVNKFAQDISEDDTVNTFKELVDYVAEHGEEAAEMAANITKNTGDITNLKSLVGETAVGTQISQAIAASEQKLSKVATSGDIGDLTQAEGYIIFDCGSSSINI